MSEIRERLECRIAIEGYATRLTAVRRSEADLQELRFLADEMEKPGISRLDLNRLNDCFLRSSPMPPTIPLWRTCTARRRSITGT